LELYILFLVLEPE